MNFQKKFSKKVITIALSCLVVIFLWSTPRPTQAQFAVFDPIVAGWTSATTLGQKISDIARYAYEKGGALAFQKALRSALNKIAMDSATWIASGDKGQKPLFNNKPLGEYFTEIADEAAGEFIENFVNNWNVATAPERHAAAITNCESKLSDCLLANSQTSFDPVAQASLSAICLQEHQKCLGQAVSVQAIGTRPVNVCQPSSLAVKLQISLGLVDSVRPRVPSCTASEMVRNWSDELARMNPENWNDQAWLNNLSGIFDPVQNDLGIALTLQSDFGSAQSETLKTKELAWLQEGRWLDVVGISGKVESLPGQAQMEAEINQTSMRENLAKYTGDAFIDAANIFINTLALQAYNRLMQGFGKTVDSTSSQTTSLSDPNADPNIRYGDVTVAEKISRILSPAFSRQANYSVVNDLSICPDQNNPGPTNCVIDSSFMQAIQEKQTVIEAVLENNLKRDWVLTTDNNKQDSYTLRNIIILIKYRILPLGWEIAAQENKTATLMDLISCFDSTDEYQDFSRNFNVSDTDWCRGLVDPNWVLKAPLNLCQKQGAGSQILSMNIFPGQPEVSGMTVANTLSTLSITRDEDYCADEQTCIKEAADGSCLFYGYCNEEKRIWTFGEGSCQPIYNTCQTFTSSVGKTASYLENTLDYGNCDQDSVGCREYFLTGNYSLADNQVNWNLFPNAYFNSDLASCAANSEGCTELMRVRPAWGNNLIMGADFRYDNIDDGLDANSLINDYWYITQTGGGSKSAKIADGTPLGYNGQKLLMLELATLGGLAGPGDIRLVSNQANPLVPNNFPVIPGYSYTLSADVFLIASDSGKAVISLGSGSQQTSQEFTEKNTWNRLSTTLHIDPQLSNIINYLPFYISGQGDPGLQLYLKNLKLEINTWDSGYSPYGAYKVYQKLIPPYLEAVCYEDGVSATKDYRLKSDAPAICFNYTRQCNKDEAGCNLFTSVRDGFAVPAKISSTDYCASECNTYDIYIAQATHFNSPLAENMIPATAQKCSADFVGCTEFTNLDQINTGGESQEYYSFLKHCIKPDDTCGNFYTWEGNEDSGYQLRVMTLQTDGAAAPALTSPDSTCNANTYFLPPWDPQYNSDCRQFYNQAGVASYRLMSRTITCSDNCNIYRMTEKNVDSSLAQAQCTGSDKNWDTSLDVCYVCKNGGTWSSAQNACLYQGIPGEGKVCQAAANGCREYTGKLGSNTRLVAAYNFNNGIAGWEGRCGHNPESSSVAISDNGLSLKYLTSGFGSCPAEENNNLGRIQLPVGNSVRQGASYSIRFLARADSAANIYFAFRNFNNGEDKFEPTSLSLPGDGEWRIYDLNLPAITHTVDANEVLYINSTGNFYIDDIIISEIQDRYYLIKNSGQVPDICYYDIFDGYRGADYNLGCSQWRDQSNVSHYLRRFTSLCQESSIGCELMIDTTNQTDWRPQTICSTDDTSCLDVAGDQFIYAKYDSTKLCAASDKGCSLMAEVKGQGNNLTTTNVFKRNNPDNYLSSLCSSSSVGCEEWRSDLGIKYFKDPVFNTCVYRHSQDLTSSAKQWYKSAVKRCDLNNDGQISGAEQLGTICQADTDCSAGTCILDNNDYLCSVSYFETIGLGGAGGRVPTPNEGVGICEATNAGCSEYLDPVSQFSNNLVTSNWSSGNSQIIQLNPNTLYSFNTPVTQTSGVTRLIFSLPIRILEDNNQFATTTTNTLSINSNLPEERGKTIYFHSQLNTSVALSADNINTTIGVKPVIISYQLRQDLDLQSCTVPNFNNGCILFNERAVQGASGLSALNIKATDSYDNRKLESCLANSDISSCNANQLIKVRPDRICSRWLDCATYIEDPVTGDKTCYELGECVALNDQGECTTFVSFADTQITKDGGNYYNLTGYSLLDRYYLGDMQEVGLDSDVHYDFEDPSIALNCTRKLNIKSVPGYTNYPDINPNACSFNTNIIKDSLIQEPVGAPTDYPAQGKGYLKVLAYQQISPHAKNFTFSLEADTNYYLHYLVNTKNAGIEAAVVLAQADNIGGYDIVFTATSTANNGWERKIHQINLLNSDDSQNLQLFLTAQAKGEEELYVYFDDIHIEPVLEVGLDEYVAKDCRLYPEFSSLSCRSQDENVIKHGLEGYCLVRDPKNINVCLLWYPLDNIRSSNLVNFQVTGYQGKAPLYYCVEANANFQLVEKRVANKILHISNNVFWNGIFPPSEYTKSPINNVIYGISTTGHCLLRGPEDAYTKQLCGTDGGEGVASYSNYVLVSGKSGFGHRVFCVPNLKNLLIKDKKTIVVADGSSCIFSYYDGWGEFNGFQFKTIVGNPDNEYINPLINLDEANNHNPAIAVYDLDNEPIFEDDLKFITNNDSDKVYQLSCNRFVQTVDSSGLNKAWANRVSPSRSSLETPTFMWEAVNDSDFITTTTGDMCVIGSSPDPSDCQTEYEIDGNAIGCVNAALPYCGQYPDGSCYFNWVYCSFKDNTECETDPYCEISTNANDYYWSKYGRNREDVPYGSAVLPNDFDFYSSPPILFRNQYSTKNQQSVFAGRPYGCSGDGCENIGQCSLNPNVFCIYEPNIALSGANLINNDSCAKGGYGTCISLWNGDYSALDPEIHLDYYFFEYPLKTIFLKTFGGFFYDYSLNMYLVNNGYLVKHSDYGHLENFALLPQCLNNIRSNINDFCAVYPTVENLLLWQGSQSVQTISEPGIYNLTFNSNIDIEQQPLSSIRIDWGDGTIQIINNQTHRPSGTAPHRIYHYYQEAINASEIKVRVVDNWEKFGTGSFSP